MRSEIAPATTSTILSLAGLDCGDSMVMVSKTAFQRMPSKDMRVGSPARPAAIQRVLMASFRSAASLVPARAKDAQRSFTCGRTISCSVLSWPLGWCKLRKKISRFISVTMPFFQRNSSLLSCSSPLKKSCAPFRVGRAG